MAIRTASTYAEIVKFEEQEDGTVIAYGKATDATLDSDEQICDPAWLKQAMPEWFKYGNIREQHSSIAAGVATEYEEKDGGHYITAHIVDPSSAKKVKTGVLKGFSIGIRRPRVIKDNKAAGGRIVDGEIVEVSIVDRPANPSCTLVVAKAVGGVMTQVEEYTEKGSPDQPRDDHGRFASDGDSGEDTLKPYDEPKDLPYGTWDEPNWGAIADEIDNHLSDAEQINSMIEPNGSEADDETFDEAAQLMTEGYTALQDASNAQQYRDVPYFLGQAKDSFEAASEALHQIGDFDNADETNRLIANIKSTVDGLNRGLGKSFRAHLLKGSPDQPRDERGRFASSDGGDSSDSGSGGSAQAAAQAHGYVSRAINDLRFLQNHQDISIEDRTKVIEMRMKLEEAEDALNYARDPENQTDMQTGIDAAFVALESAYDSSDVFERSQNPIFANYQNTPDRIQAAIDALESEQSIKSTSGNLVKDISTRVNKYAATDIKKFDQGSFDTARRALATLIQVEAGEMADGHDETYSLSCLLQAVHSLMCWYEGEEAEGETVEMPEGIEMSDEAETVKAEDTVCETCGEKECKCSSKADEVEDSACKECGEKECKCAEGGYRATEKSANTEDDLRATITDIVKSLLPTEVGEVDATKAAESERIEVLEAELARVKSLAAPNGPRRFGAVSSTSKEQLNKAKARQLRVKAEMTLDKALADGYRQMARDLETNSETE